MPHSSLLNKLQLLAVEIIAKSNGRSFDTDIQHIEYCRLFGHCLAMSVYDVKIDV